jgi:hypothetical protein
VSEEATGEWDPQYLQSISTEESGPSHEGDAGAEVPNGRSNLASLASSGGTLSATQARGDATMAFDERALDSFFNDQDLGESRGLGRFRRRQ